MALAVAMFTTKSLTKLAQEQEALAAEMDKLNGLLSESEDDAEREQIKGQIDQMLERFDQIDEDIKQQKAIKAKLEKLDEPRDSKAAPKHIDVPQADRSEPENDGDVKIKIPATAIRTTVKNFRKETICGMRPDERAFAFGRFLMAVAARTAPGTFGHFNHLIEGHSATFGTMQAATEGGNAGIWVPTQFGTDLISLMEKFGLARDLFDVKPMTSDKRTDPKEGSDPEPVFVGEGVEGTDVTPQDDRTVTLSAKKLMAILLASSEVNEDAVVSFGDSMLRRMANGFAKKEDQCGWLGDGTSTYGGMIGINTRLQDIDGAGTDAGGLITGTAGSGAALTGFTLNDFHKVVAALPDFADDSEDAAQWVVHKTFYYEVMARLMLAQGGVTAEETASGRRRPLFLGFPVRWSNVMPKAAATNTVFASFGDHRKGVSMGDRRSYSVDFSQQATVGSVNLWSSDQIGIKATERFDIQAHSLGDSDDAGAVVGLQSAGS